MGNAELVSIIVPVYNAEKYLENCLMSLINQKYQNLEILLIDDGSTDQSLKICQEFAEKDKRIKVFNKENAGAGEARNYGIKKATGEYICFVDSDDYVDENYISCLYHALKKTGLKMSACLCLKVTDGAVIKPENCNKIQIVSDEMKYQYVLDDHLIGSFPVNKLFSKELFDHLEFDHRRYFEDLGTIYKFAAAVDAIAFVPSNLYFYRIFDESTSHKRNEQFYIDLFDLGCERYYFIDHIYPNLLENDISILDIIFGVYTRLRNTEGFDDRVNKIIHKIRFKPFAKMSKSDQIKYLMFRFSRGFYSFVFNISYSLALKHKRKN